MDILYFCCLLKYLLCVIFQNPKVLIKVEESCNQCRRLILKLSTDTSYKLLYMKEQFLNDMKKMVLESVILLKEVITNLSSNVGLTTIEKVIAVSFLLIYQYYNYYNTCLNNAYW